MSEIIYKGHVIVTRYAGPAVDAGSRMRYQITNPETGQALSLSAVQWDELRLLLAHPAVVAGSVT